MAKITKYVGIDVSSEKFDYYYLLADGTQKRGTFSYHEKDLSKFIGLLSPDSHCVMEATGIYHLTLAVYLYDHGIMVSVINPLVIKRYGQMLLNRTKTDKSDATLIYNYAATMKPEQWKPDAEHHVQMQQLISYERLLIKHRTALNNHLLALLKCPVGCPQVISDIKNQLAAVDSSIKQIEKKLLAICKEYYQDEFECMTSIPGIGKKTAVILLATVKGFEDFETAKQLCSYFGMAPRIYQSGSSVNGKARICKMGMSHIRQLLYMCARSASRYNYACKIMYQRLLEKGKPKKLALIAVANKLIKQLFAIVKNKLKYYENIFAYQHSSC